LLGPVPPLRSCTHAALRPCLLWAELFCVCVCVVCACDCVCVRECVCVGVFVSACVRVVWTLLSLSHSHTDLLRPIQRALALCVFGTICVRAFLLVSLSPPRPSPSFANPLSCLPHFLSLSAAGLRADLGGMCTQSTEQEDAIEAPMARDLD